MGMKRRSFLRGLLGLAAAPAVAKAIEVVDDHEAHVREHMAYRKGMDRGVSPEAVRAHVAQHASESTSSLNDLFKRVYAGELSEHPSFQTLTPLKRGSR